MSIIKTMHTGVSGLLAETRALGIIGDNVANTNTVGFKGSRAQFEDVLGDVSAHWKHESGMGVRVVRAQQIFSQGALTSTGVPTDLALSGDGFFLVQGAMDGSNGRFFTRNGQMTVRNDGVVVNPQGLELQGYKALASGGFETSLSSLNIPSGTLEPKLTDTVGIDANLDVGATAPALPFDVNDPVATSNFSTSLTVYDTQGNAHVVDTYFVKTAIPNEWDIHVLGDSSEIATPAPANVGDSFTQIATGTATFDGTGKLQTLPAITAPVSYNNANAQTITFDFGDPIAAGGTGQLGLTQYGAPSNISAQTQNGYAPGSLNGLDITSDGIINGVYTNGEVLAIGQIAVAKFPANNELDRFGHNLWVQTRDSGEAVIGQAGVGGRAAIISHTLEQSNVDLANEFVNMIAHQRAFSANAKTITTADEMLMETTQLKR
jgi:flagellar hook protein FlgE